MDPESGDKTSSLIHTRIQRAIILQAREFRSFVYDLAFISANKDFTTGGFFDPEDQKVIIASVDVPIGFDPKIDDYYIYKNEKYEVKEIVSLGNNYAFVLTTRKVRGAPIVRIMETFSTLDLQHGASSEVQDQLNQSITSILNLTQELKEVP